MLMAKGAGAQNSVKPFHLDEATIKFSGTEGSRLALLRADNRQP